LFAEDNVDMDDRLERNDERFVRVVVAVEGYG